MSEKKDGCTSLPSQQRVLEILANDGETLVYGEKADALIFHLDMREIYDEENAWYARDILVAAESWPEWWKTLVNLEDFIELVEREGIEPPEWVRKHRDNRLLATLTDLQNL